MSWDPKPQHYRLNDGKTPSRLAARESQARENKWLILHNSSTHSPSPAPENMSQPQYAPAATAGGQQNGPVSCSQLARDALHSRALSFAPIDSDKRIDV